MIGALRQCLPRGQIARSVHARLIAHAAQRDIGIPNELLVQKLVATLASVGASAIGRVRQKLVDRKTI